MQPRRPLRPGIRIALLVVVPLIAALLVTLLFLVPDDSSDVDTRGAPTTVRPGTVPTSSTTQPPRSTTSTSTTVAPATTAVVTDTTKPAPPTPPPGPGGPPAAPAFASSIEPVTAEQLGASWHAGCPLAPDQLRLVTVTHWGFDGTARQGQLVVNADHADNIVTVMTSLFDQRYPIERMEPISVYGGSDDASMAVNNTSAFNCRPVTGGTSWSHHSYGWAIDINPIQNPYVTGRGTVLPPAGAAYTDRGDVRPGMVVAGDATVAAFDAIGWSWGGYWDDPVDYQHFSATGG